MLFLPHQQSSCRVPSLHAPPTFHFLSKPCTGDILQNMTGTARVLSHEHRKMNGLNLHFNSISKSNNSSIKAEQTQQRRRKRSGPAVHQVTRLKTKSVCFLHNQKNENYFAFRKQLDSMEWIYRKSNAHDLPPSSKAKPARKLKTLGVFFPTLLPFM